MEELRKRLAQDKQLYPDPPSVVTIRSSPESESVGKKQRPIVISDEEDQLETLVKVKPSNVVPSRSWVVNKPSKGVPIPVPAKSSLYTPVPIRTENEPAGEAIQIPDFVNDRVYMSSKEADEALRQLIEGSVNDDVDIDMDDATVEGFKPNIKLLPHQVLGRAWMRERENAERKTSGGILADDMGLGKTIQTLTRIVEGRPHKKDKEDGWSASTLVVCPLALVGQWADEIAKMAKNLVVLQHHGPSRTADPTKLRKTHVVITTYDVVKSEYGVFNPEAKLKSRKKKEVTAAQGDDDSSSDDDRLLKKRGKAGPKKKDALFHVNWWRIVLDEAHTIKNRSTQGATACCALEGRFRWCLTGTPMQNDVTELFSLFKFLRIKPLCVWEEFNDLIAKPVKNGQGASRAMKRLQVVLNSVMLRRRKDQFLNGKALVELPKRVVEVVSCEFNATEQAFYDSLSDKMGDALRKILSAAEGKVGNAYISVLLLLLRLRQACNHPILVSKDYKKDIEAVEPKTVKETNKELLDPDDLATALGQLSVNIRKCQVCTMEIVSSDPTVTHCQDCAPLARQSHSQSKDVPDSAKIRKIVEILHAIDERSGGEEKTIIFSQFTSMLDLIEPFLTKEGIHYVRYDGSMNPQEREKSLRAIRSSQTTQVILISFKAGSTGLNLTACNNVILTDLWWNPALEDQAFDRAHRFGQTRDVNIFKLKIDGTVEDRILELQEKKRELSQAALSGEKIKLNRLGNDELLALFRKDSNYDD